MADEQGWRFGHGVTLSFLRNDPTPLSKGWQERYRGDCP
ncbi:hypothetical protein U91I_03186 [alpha proteobacterium U9-1i]|nr:hypothetical protein U91I_03186 [alpha proteobacterium U9-1i]